MAIRIELTDIETVISIKQNKIIGVTFSCWDIMHAGHQLFLEDAKKNCDILCIGLQTDPTIDRPQKNKPIQSLEEREIQLKSSRYIDYYFIYDTEKSLYESLLLLKPTVRFLGDDYIGKEFTGNDIPISIRYHKRSAHTFSTTNLRNRIFELEHAKRNTL
jgi:glycerol-3-phosphate cytidylyltransferase